MPVTISTHNGSSACRGHNIRDKKIIAKEPHIDPNGHYEIWVDIAPRQAYKEIFGRAVEDYNAHQSRADRRINDYYADVCKDKKRHATYEMIIGIYGKDDSGNALCSDEQGKAIMQEYVKGWAERNPHLRLIGAYYHADEPAAQPHVHIDYVPVATGYKRGLYAQNGLVKALGQQGFIKQGKDTAQIQWQRAENDHLTLLCEKHGLTVSHPRIEGRKHKNTLAYKLDTAIKDMSEEYHRTKNIIEKVQKAEKDTDFVSKFRDNSLKSKATRVLSKEPITDTPIEYLHTRTTIEGATVQTMEVEIDSLARVGDMALDYHLQLTALNRTAAMQQQQEKEYQERLKTLKEKEKAVERTQRAVESREKEQRDLIAERNEALSESRKLRSERNSLRSERDDLRNDKFTLENQLWDTEYINAQLEDMLSSDMSKHCYFKFYDPAMRDKLCQRLKQENIPFKAAESNGIYAVKTSYRCRDRIEQIIQEIDPPTISRGHFMGR